MKRGEKIGKKIVKCINISPYKQELVVVCNGEFEDAYHFIKKQKTKNAQETIRHIEENREKYFEPLKRTSMELFTELPHGYVVVLHHCDSWIETAGSVMHEALHLTHYVLRRAGITLSVDSEEAFTYLAEHVAEEILEIIY